jgi:hypothetical protein
LTTNDQLGRILLVFLVGAAAPLLAITAVSRRWRLTWRLAVLTGALSEAIVALLAGAFIFVFAECLTGPCPATSLWERLRWWIVAGAVGALDGVAVAVVVMSLRWTGVLRLSDHGEGVAP